MVTRKANSPTLSREQIITATMRLVDRDGLSALSMRRLATELGVGTMSLYYHVPDKSTLYDLLLDACIAEIDLSADDGGAPPEERVRRIVYALRQAMLSHPQIAILAMSRSMRTPAQLRPVERMLQIFREAGLSAPEAMRAVNVIGQYTVGVTSMYAGHLNAGAYRDQHEGEYGDLVPEEFPGLFEMMQQADNLRDWDADFEAGLSALLTSLVIDKAAAAAR